MSDISFLLLSCDKYQDLWYDFFRLKDLFWPDCPYKWTIVTEDADFYYPEISVLKCGTHLNWTGRLKYAIENLNTKHVCYFLDDFFINSRKSFIKISSSFIMTYNTILNIKLFYHFNINFTSRFIFRNTKFLCGQIIIFLIIL